MLYSRSIHEYWRENAVFAIIKKSSLNWPNHWADNHTFKTGTDAPKKPKFLCLTCFPYPSGAGLHVGAQKDTQHDWYPQPTQTMHKATTSLPNGMGCLWFACRAVCYGYKPGRFTAKKCQLQTSNQCAWIPLTTGYVEVNTTDQTHKWTQWIFAKLYEKGLAYEAERVPVNWVGGNSHCHEKFFKMEHLSVVTIQLSVNQSPMDAQNHYMLERLLNDLDDLGWPESIRTCNATELENQLNLPMSLRWKVPDKNSPHSPPAPFLVQPSLFWLLSMTW